MANSEDLPNADDPYDLDRFAQVQQENYNQALAEIARGQKRTHWMWYIFPQIDGLGFSPTSKHFAIKSLNEAKAYLTHPVLGPRLIECAQAVIDVEDRSATEIFGSPDDMKLQSCATLFAGVSSPDSVFDRILTKYFAGRPDERTLQLSGLNSQDELSAEQGR